MAVKDWQGFRHTENASIALWYGSDLANPVTTNGSSGTLYASADIGPGGQLASALIGIFGGIPASGMYARMALYRTDGTANLYPATLVTDIGCVTAASMGFNRIVTSAAIAADTLYWRVVWTSGVGAFALAGTGGDGQAVFGHAFGIDESHGGLTAPYTGDLVNSGFPSTFPSSGRSIGSTNRPTFYLSYSGAA
jgi:hypothetical protein